MKDSITSPFSTATPHSAMKPTAAVMDSGMPRIHSAITPPVKANGMPVKTTSPSLTLPNMANSSANTRSSAAGTTICSRLAADCSCSNVPPHDVQYPEGTFTCSPMAVDASATKEPRSRPRTLALTTMRRLPSSREIWLGPGARPPAACAVLPGSRARIPAGAQRCQTAGRPGRRYPPRVRPPRRRW
ncbi:hypothetical protein G6F22_018166 [Rhizopus arrhizus]|nr:hypothetical protein G6F22_018166 [Rhizopus arrhizus]